MIETHTANTYIWIYLIYIIVTSMIVNCEASCICDPGYYCHSGDNNNNNTISINKTDVTEKCILCFDCLQYHRSSLVSCSKELSDCGSCLPGYADNSKDGSAVSSTCTLITSEGLSSNDTGTNALLIFSIIVPAAGLIVLILALALGRIYHKRILQKVQSAQELLNQE